MSSTRYLCLSCGFTLDACRCETPTPAEGDPPRSVRMSRRPWTREEVRALLEAEALQRQAEGAARVEDVKRRRRSRRQD